MVVSIPTPGPSLPRHHQCHRLPPSAQVVVFAFRDHQPALQLHLEAPRRLLRRLHSKIEASTVPQRIGHPTKRMRFLYRVPKYPEGTTSLYHHLPWVCPTTMLSTKMSTTPVSTTTTTTTKATKHPQHGRKKTTMPGPYHFHRQQSRR
jgi:hypothetical protein